MAWTMEAVNPVIVKPPGVAHSVPFESECVWRGSPVTEFVKSPQESAGRPVLQFQRGEIATVPCGRCRQQQLPWTLKRFGDKEVCADCFSATLELASAAIKVTPREPGRACSGCRALHNPSFGSAWCAVGELGDDRALICANFVPQAVEDARVDMKGHRIDAIDVWHTVSQALRNTLGDATYDRWFAQIEPVDIDASSLVLAVPDEFTRDWLQQRLGWVVATALSSTGFAGLEPQYVVEAVMSSQAEPPGPSASETKLRLGFNPHYSFGEFVVGSGNRLAHASALACVDKPGRVYNPLVLYGGVGVGKTHLLQAIGQEVVENGNSNVLYATSETFTNELISAIREGTTGQFRERYRGVDYLLLDDIQFIAGKEATQEEFFHTFNALHQAGKQIVVTCDRPPSELKVLEARLRSRFAWGMLADMQPPDYETRMAIVRAKAALRDRRIPETVLNALATRAGNNVRELEGALNRVIALADLMGQEPGAETVRQVLGEVETGRGSCRPADVLQAVAAYFRVKTSDLAGQQRERKVSYARQVAMFLLREEAKLSLVDIGHQLGGRNHSTVIYSCEKISGQKSGGRVKADLQALRQLIYGPR
jgi:chromosomal replication initiator protein